MCAHAFTCRSYCYTCSAQRLAQLGGNVVTTSSNNGTPGVWQCADISCNLAGWQGSEEGDTHVLALLRGGVSVAVCRPPLQQPAVHLLIHLAMCMLNGLVALRRVGWVGQQLPAWGQQSGRLVVHCSVVKADDEVLSAAQPSFKLPVLQLLHKLTEYAVELCCCDVTCWLGGVSW